MSDHYTGPSVSAFAQMLEFGTRPKADAGLANCGSCKTTVVLKSSTIQGVKYRETVEGKTCPKCGEPMNLGGDKTDHALAQLMAERKHAHEVAEAASVIGSFHAALLDHGVDSFGAAILAERLATGQIDARNLSGCWKRD